MREKLVITKDQLEALQEYMEMYGVEAMGFDKEDLSETLENFAAKPVEYADKYFSPPVGRCWLIGKPAPDA